ncbi:YtxH domain-containing protein [Acidobacteriota bacterium]
MSNNGSTALEVTLSFLLGTATGFILGVLFAPASGEDTRKKIQERAQQTGAKAKENYEKIAKEAEKGIAAVKEKAAGGVTTVKEKTTEGIEAVKDFVEKKKEEIAKKPPEDLPKPDNKNSDIF